MDLDPTLDLQQLRDIDLPAADVWRAWTDPEFLKGRQTLDQLPPQLYLGAAMSAVVGIGAMLIAGSTEQSTAEPTASHQSIQMGRGRWLGVLIRAVSPDAAAPEPDRPPR